MSQITSNQRLALKTPEASLLHVLQEEFNLSPREAREIVTTACEILGLDRPTSQVRPGQVRLVVASLAAPIGPPLQETDRVEVTLTVDAGVEDAEVLAQQGRLALRAGRILRLVDEALLYVKKCTLTSFDKPRQYPYNHSYVDRIVSGLELERGKNERHTEWPE